MAALGRWLSNWLGALPLLAVVGFCLVAPVVVLFGRSFITHDGIGLDIWAQLLNQDKTRQALLNSVALGATCALISTAVGTPLAWLVSRMAVGRRAAWLGVFNVAAHFGGIGLAFAYVATLGAFGMVTLFIQGMGVDFAAPSRDSFIALVIAYEYANIPLFVLLALPAMAILRDEWYEAAQAAAATRLVFWRRIGLPILAPFVLGGALLSFTWAIGIYGIAYALAGSSPVPEVRLLTLQIGQTLADDAVNGASRAGALSALLVLIAVVALAAYRLLVRRGLRWFGGHAPIAAARPVAHSRRPSRSERLARILTLGSLVVWLGLPLLALALYSFATSWTDRALPNGYTLEHWLTTFVDDRAANAFLTSLVLSALTMLLTLVLVVPAVYWARTVNPRVRSALELAAAIPFALPFLVIGLALLQFSGLVAPALQGTAPLLLAGYVSITFPFVYWAIDGAMAAAGVEHLAQAAEACGASRLQTLLRVILPNIRSGLASGAMLAFATVIGEYAMVSVLASSINTIPVWSAHVLLDRFNPGFAPLSVMTLTVFALLLAVSVVVARATRGRPVREAA